MAKEPKPIMDIARAAELQKLGCDKIKAVVPASASKQTKAALMKEAAEKREQCFEAEIQKRNKSKDKRNAIKVMIYMLIILPLIALGFFLVWKFADKPKKRVKLPKKSK